jgi:hypothetical protein
MKAALVWHPNQPPIYGDFETPTAAPGEITVSVTAAALPPCQESRLRHPLQFIGKISFCRWH